MYRNIKILCCLLFVSCATAFATSKIKPVDGSSVKITESWLKDRESLNMTFIDSIEPDRLLHNFRINAGLQSDAQPLGGWEAPKIGLRGHFVGHYLSTLAKRVNNTGNQEVKKKLDYMIDALKECQDKVGTGCLTAFPENDFDTLEHKFWGVWAPYYTYHKMMQGLYDAYTLAGNDKAFEMLLKMADYVDKRMSRIDSLTIEKLLDTKAAMKFSINYTVSPAIAST